MTTNSVIRGVCWILLKNYLYELKIKIGDESQAKQTIVDSIQEVIKNSCYAK